MSNNVSQYDTPLSSDINKLWDSQLDVSGIISDEEVCLYGLGKENAKDGE